ncbi:MAG TPA: hypothetical protein ENN81_11420 [Phycisphaerales bacterium]|nr:hypothetical protein [Phycisphaerales bacterium]
MKDMMVLVADKNMETAVRTLLSRHEALGIRPVEADVFRHPQRDSGCCNKGVEFFSALAGRFRKLLLLFDHEGCGRESERPEEIEAAIERDLSVRGWSGNASVIVLDPELEIWVWSPSPHVEDCLGWRDADPPLRQWLVDNGYLRAGGAKPARPKEAMEEALRLRRIPRSSAIYGQLAQKVSLHSCADRAFTKFRDTLQQWFAVGAGAAPWEGQNGAVLM